ncbi:hypothetical protein [Litorivivens sp.]|uniref:hypothetical protein n=1 Tax=Litorivivens sp. TaxID=2020868 RepID=UPI0035680A85
MIFRAIHWASLALTSTCALAAESLPPCSPLPLIDVIEKTAGGDYVQPDAIDIASAASLFEHHFRNPEEIADYRSDWQALGFDLVELCHEQKRWWLIREINRRGRGAFLFSANPDSSLVLQAPHRRDDWGTGRLTAKLAQENNPRAVAWNTTPRRIDDEPGPGDADLAHLDRSFLQAFTLGQARGLKNSRLIQIHGYSADKRKTSRAQKSTIIISSGRHFISAPVFSIYNCLYRQIRGVLIFPDTVKELGGTTNSQGRLFMEQRQDGFVHLEIDRSLREKLLQSPSLRRTLYQCLATAY